MQNRQLRRLITTMTQLEILEEIEAVDFAEEEEDKLNGFYFGSPI